MLAPEEKLKFSTKPYLAATPQFKSGSSSPREFLERCLVDLTALEPKIGAFVHLNIEAARNAADASSARWRAGCPLSPIDGMPTGIKDIIETADFPTENGSPIYFGWRSERDKRRCLARSGRGDPRQDGDHRIRRHRAGRHPQPA
jgi:Asp-tRNA(Asn)/Glu-tRNA(Gln) amidotransferase A subunit family amidase